MQKNEPNKIILHCSATADIGDLIGATTIKRWHVQENGWNDIGYHYVIRRTGLVEIGRAEDVIGSHTKGFNEDSIGICLVGTKHFTDAQYEALGTLIKAIKTRHQIRPGAIYGHYEFNPQKECPGVDMGLIRIYLNSIFKI